MQFFGVRADLSLALLTLFSLVRSYFTQPWGHIPVVHAAANKWENCSAYLPQSLRNWITILRSSIKAWFYLFYSI